MKLQIQNILEFLDEKKPEHESHTSPLIGLFGEELVTRLFINYLERKGARAETIDKPVTTGKVRGPRLDAWILVTKSKKKILYQAEVKNWAAYAYGSWGDPVDVDEKQLIAKSKRRFEEQKAAIFSGKEQDKIVSKVLVPMKKPESYEALASKPALLYWWPISNNGVEPISEISVGGKGGFSSLLIFSASLYLRQLNKSGRTELNLNTPKLEKRLKLLKPLFK